MSIVPYVATESETCIRHLCHILDPSVKYKWTWRFFYVCCCRSYLSFSMTKRFIRRWEMIHWRYQWKLFTSTSRTLSVLVSTTCGLVW